MSSSNNDNLPTALAGLRLKRTGETTLDGGLPFVFDTKKVDMILPGIGKEMTNRTATQWKDVAETFRADCVIIAQWKGERTPRLAKLKVPKIEFADKFVQLQVEGINLVKVSIPSGVLTGYAMHRLLNGEGIEVDIENYDTLVVKALSAKTYLKMRYTPQLGDRPQVGKCYDGYVKSVQIDRHGQKPGRCFFIDVNGHVGCIYENSIADKRCINEVFRPGSKIRVRLKEDRGSRLYYDYVPEGSHLLATDEAVAKIVEFTRHANGSTMIIAQIGNQNYAIHTPKGVKVQWLVDNNLLSVGSVIIVRNMQDEKGIKYELAVDRPFDFGLINGEEIQGRVERGVLHFELRGRSYRFVAPSNKFCWMGVMFGDTRAEGPARVKIVDIDEYGMPLWRSKSDDIYTVMTFPTDMLVRYISADGQDYGLERDGLWFKFKDRSFARVNYGLRPKLGDMVNIVAKENYKDSTKIYLEPSEITTAEAYSSKLMHAAGVYRVRHSVLAPTPGLVAVTTDIGRIMVPIPEDMPAWAVAYMMLRHPGRQVEVDADTVTARMIIDVTSPNPADIWPDNEFFTMTVVDYLPDFGWVLRQGNYVGLLKSIFTYSEKPQVGQEISVRYKHRSTQGNLILSCKESDAEVAEADSVAQPDATTSEKIQAMEGDVFVVKVVESLANELIVTDGNKRVGEIAADQIGRFTVDNAEGLFAPGNKITVKCLGHTSSGDAILSRAAMMGKEMHPDRQIMEVKVVKSGPNGMIVNYQGAEAYIPASEISWQMGGKVIAPIRPANSTLKVRRIEQADGSFALSVRRASTRQWQKVPARQRRDGFFDIVGYAGGLVTVKIGNMNVAVSYNGGDISPDDMMELRCESFDLKTGDIRYTAIRPVEKRLTKLYECVKVKAPEL